MRQVCILNTMAPGRIFRPLLGCFLLYLFACAGCASFQRRCIYFPPVFNSDQANDFGSSQKLARWVSPAGIPIGWKRLSATQPGQGQVLITHGNAGCALQCGHYANVIQQVAPLDVFIVEYPGYADRPGKPTERTLEASADEALQCLDSNRPIYLLGESLGTGVAAYLAGRHSDQVAGVVLLAPYTSLVDVGQAHMFLVPVWLLLRDRFPAQDFLRDYRGPVAMLVARDDTVVPAKFGRRLFDRYHGPKRLSEVPHGDHGAIMTQPTEFWQEVFDFWHAPRPATTRTLPN